jgi:hypothetical protein
MNASVVAQTEKLYPSTNPVSCMKLFSGGVKNYIAECAEASENITKVFFHLPKTGGSSLRIALDNEFSNGLHISKYSDLNQWDEVLVRQREQPYDMISGHINQRALSGLYASGAPIVAMTFIREPIARILSQYRYMVSPKYPNNEEFRAKFPTLVEFSLDGIPENPMLNIFFDGCKTVDEALKKAARDFMFIGLTEYSAMHGFLIQRCFGLDKFHMPPWVNRTVSMANNQIELDKESLGILREKCGLDLAFYSQIKRRHMAIADDVFSAFYEAFAGDETPFAFKTKP